jgi:hypothetical protein
MGGNNNFMQALMNLKRSFNGDPQEKIQELLNSGKVTQAQYNAAVQKAQTIQQMMQK